MPESRTAGALKLAGARVVLPSELVIVRDVQAIVIVLTWPEMASGWSWSAIRSPVYFSVS